jgi:hypothetical protein
MYNICTVLGLGDFGIEAIFVLNINYVRERQISHAHAATNAVFLYHL